MNEILPNIIALFPEMASELEARVRSISSVLARSVFVDSLRYLGICLGHNSTEILMDKPLAKIRRIVKEKKKYNVHEIVLSKYKTVLTRKGVSQQMFPNEVVVAIFPQL